MNCHSIGILNRLNLSFICGCSTKSKIEKCGVKMTWNGKNMLVQLFEFWLVFANKSEYYSSLLFIIHHYSYLNIYFVLGFEL